jgi:phosphatidylglycerophosphate synthase
VIGVRSGLLAAVTGLVVLLGGLAAVSGIGVAGPAVALACAAVLGTAADRSARRAGVRSWGPADVVTLVRATLACGVAALVTDALVAQASVPVPVLVSLAVVALALDAVDGRVARRTGTVSPLGARLDGEADAFLMLVLSVHVAAGVGAWVLAIGLVRYAFAVAGWVLPWMRADLPSRYWRKVVTAVAGIALVWAVAGLPGTYAALGLATLLLAESFGRDVGWLWRRRSVSAAVVAPAAGLASP